MKTERILLLILLSALFIRTFGLDLMLIDDNAIHPIAAQTLAKGEYPFYDHPPIFLFIDYLSFKVDTLLLDFTNLHISWRLIPLIFGLLTILVVYYLASLIYDQQTALVSAFIMAVCFYHIWASLVPDPNGSSLTLFITLALFAYLSSKDRLNWWVIAAGLLLGISLLTKYVAILLLPVLFVFELLRRKSVKNAAITSAIGLFILFLFPLTAYMAGRWEIFLITFKWGVTHVSRHEPGFILFAKSFFKHIYKLVMYATPLLTLLPLSAFLHREGEKELLLFSWIGIFLFFYIFVTPTMPIARFQMLIIPPLVILSAKEIMRNKFDKGDIKRLLFLTIIFIFLIFSLNAFGSETTPLTFEHFDASLLSKNPDIWYTGFSGPLFRVSSYSFFLVALLGFVFFIFYTWGGSPRTWLVLLIALSLAFNLLLIGELFFYNFSPNYNEVMGGMIDYYHENGLSEPVYSKYEDLPYYVGAEYHSAKGLQIVEVMRTEGGTVMWLNLPPLFEGGPLWNTLKKIKSTCELEKTFYSKNYEAGYIFLCDKTS